MENRKFGDLREISVLSLGGGGIGQVWGPTTRKEAVSTVLEAVDSGITFLDMAPSYGNGEAEAVIGEAFNGRLPEGVRVSTKCHLNNPPADEVYSILEASLRDSLGRMRLERVDMFFLHGLIIPDADKERYQGTTRSLFVDAVRPAFAQLREKGLIGAWGITGIGVPSAVIETLSEKAPPQAVQVITNPLDSPGALKRYDEPARPREIISTANMYGVPVMGIRAVQAGAFTNEFDRPLPEDHPDMTDYRKTAPFRRLAKQVEESPASLAHRYAAFMESVSTVVLGVKNRVELRECIEAVAKGTLETELRERIDSSVRRA